MRLVRGRPLPVGIAVLATLALLVGLALAINLSFGVPWGQDYRISARFNDANGLARGADVNIAGRQVGQVVDVRPQGGQALVTMRIDSSHAPLHRGTVARIRYSTLLAQKYVELAPVAGTPILEAGTTIPSDQTITPVDFDQFLSAFDPVTRQRLQEVVQQGGGGVAGRQAAINDLLDQLAGLAVESRAGLSTFRAHDRDLDSLTGNLAVTSHRLAENHEQLGQFVANTGVVTRTLAREDRPLASLIVHLANVMQDFDETLNGNEANLRETVTNLDPLVVELNRTLGTTYGYLHETMPAIKGGFDVLIPRIGSAISERDANGQNLLRQYVIADQCYDSMHQQADCGTQRSAPAAETVPSRPSQGAGPTDRPRPTPTPCPSLPAPPTVPPNPLPTPLPTVCPILPCLPTPAPAPTTSPAASPCPSPPGSPSGLPPLPTLPPLPPLPTLPPPPWAR